jgi:hypothetical protein
VNIVEEYLQNWVTRDGGGMLDPADRAPPFEGCTLERTKNDNPILFLVQMAVEVIKTQPQYLPQFKENFERHMTSTQIVPGLHSRRCGDTPFINQSHDNIVAMVIGSYFLGGIYGENVYQYGARNQWCYNVQASGQYDLKYALQGGDIAICAYATRRKPEPWYILWLAGGMVLSKDFNLTDLRIQLLEAILPSLSKWEQSLLSTAISIHKWRRGSGEKYGGTRFGYYSNEHPFSRFVKAGGTL